MLISILFIMPGSALPPEGWLYRFYPDKWVHVGFFAILIFLWRSAFNWQLKNYNAILLFSALLYGLLVEVVQKQWVPNRSFDVYDVLADVAGSFFGLIIWVRANRKK